MRRVQPRQPPSKQPPLNTSAPASASRRARRARSRPEPTSRQRRGAARPRTAPRSRDRAPHACALAARGGERGPEVRVLCLPLAPSSFISAAPTALRCCCVGEEGVGIHACLCVHTHTYSHVRARVLSAPLGSRVGEGVQWELKTSPKPGGEPTDEAETSACEVIFLDPVPSGRQSIKYRVILKTPMETCWVLE